MPKSTVKSSKTDAPAVPDSKTSPPMSSQVADLVEQAGLDKVGVREVLTAPTPTEAIRQTITHPVVLAVVVGGLLMAFGGRR